MLMRPLLANGMRTFMTFGGVGMVMEKIEHVQEYTAMITQEILIATTVWCGSGIRCGAPLMVGRR